MQKQNQNSEAHHDHHQHTSHSYRYDNRYEHKQLLPKTPLNNDNSRSNQNLRVDYIGANISDFKQKHRNEPLKTDNNNNVQKNNVTIWREELNAKNNIQQQIKKRV